MRRLIAFGITFIMLLSLFTMPAMATVEDGVVLLDMDFESAAPANLLDTMTTGTTNANKLFTTTDENIKISWTSSDTTNAPQTLAEAKNRGYVGVVNAATEGVSDANHTGNVFKYYHKQGTEAAGKGFLMTKLAPNMGADATVDNHTVVMEYDVYLQTQNQQTGVLNILENADDYHANYLSNHTNLFVLPNVNVNTVAYNGGPYDSATNTNPQKSDVIEYQKFTSTTGSILGKWTKVRVVADLTAKEGVVKDTFRLYVDDVLRGTNFAGSERMVYDLQELDGKMFADTFYGLEMGGKTGSTTKAVYYDNVKVTKYPGKFEIVENNIPAEAAIGTDYTVTFNRNIDADTVSDIYVTDTSGNKIDGAVTASASDKVLTVRFTSALAQLTNYKLVLPATFTDELGQGLVTYYVNNTTSANYAAYKSSDKIIAFATNDDPVDAIDFGDCGDGVEYVLSNDGTLTISGTGAMSDFESQSTPWYAHKDSITSIAVLSGVTKIGANAFENCANVTTVSISDTVATIGANAFSGCTSLASVSVNENNNSFASIDGNLFDKNATELIMYLTNDAEYEIPESVSVVKSYAFSNSSNLTILSVPNSLTTVEENAFDGAVALTDVFYNGTEAEWQNVSVSTTGNSALTGANFSFLTVTGIEVTAPSKTNYAQGTELDLTGLVVKVVYSNGTEVEVAEGYTVTGYDKNVLGSQTVTVTCEGFEESFTVTVIEPGIVLFEDFESASAGNLLDTMTASTSNPNNLFDTTISNIKISYSAGGLANAKTRGFVGVVDVSENSNTALNNGEHTKVFKYQHNGATDANFLMVKLNPEADTDKDISDNIVVVEYDAYLEAQHAQVLVLSPARVDSDYHANYLTSNTAHFMLNGGNYIRYTAKKYESGKDTYIEKDVVEYDGFNINNVANKWIKVKYVFDATDKTGTTKRDTFRFYIDGKLVSTKFAGPDENVYDFVGGDAGQLLDIFEGFIAGGKANASNGAMYYDNVKVTKHDDKFAIVSKSFEDGQTNIEKDATLTFTFNSDIDANTIDEVYLKDASGNKVEDAVTVSIDETDSKKLNVKLNSANVQQLTDYTVVIPGSFTDVNGQGLVSFYLYNIDRTTYPAYASIPKTSATEFSFKTAERIEATATPAVVENYDLGMAQEIVFDFGREYIISGNLNDAFEVTDKNGNVISGLVATQTDATKITVQLSGLALGDGIHYINVIPGAIKDANGAKMFASASIKTVDFNAVPSVTSIEDYVFGAEQTVDVVSNIELKDVNWNTAFDVTDKDGNLVGGVVAAKDGNTVTIDISRTKFGKGTNTIKPNANFTDLRGRTADFEITVAPLALSAAYENTVSGYEKGTDKKIGISLSQPLKELAANAFTVKNAYGMTVSGLAASVSADMKTVSLQLKGLDISGGTYEIVAADGNIKAANNESYGEIKITLSTNAISQPVEDAGVAEGSGSAYVQRPQATMLIEESFEDYEANVEWLDNAPEKWTITKYNTSAFADDSVMVVADPKNANNKVLMVSAGHNDADGNVVSDGNMYNTIIRNVDNQVSAELLADPDVRISIKGKVYIPTEHYGNFSIWAGSADEEKGLRKATFINALGAGNNLAIKTDVTRVNSTRATKTVTLHRDVKPYAEDLTQSAVASADNRHQIENDKWHELEYVFRTINGRRYYQFIYDGTVYTGNSESQYQFWNAADNLSDFNGMMTRLVSNAVVGTSPVVYYDDWQAKAYFELDTHVDIPKTDVAPDDDITLTFSNSLTQDSFAQIQNEVKLTDEAGKEIEVTVEKLTDNSVKVIPATDLRYATDYSITVENSSGALVDVFDQTLSPVAYNFTTAKAFDAAIDTAQSAISYIGDIQTATSINYTMKLTENAPTEYIGVVAIYSGNGTLISMQSQTIAAGSDNAAFTLSAPEGGTVFVRMYLYERTSGNVFSLAKHRYDEISAK